ncbi:MAG: Fe2+-dependent dioxygenase [Ponticaulis sp.]|nr:Fe2+-dependent dioxygenase [Ponticaulis sp.]
MPLIIGNVLSQKQVAEIDGELDKLVWEDGTKTAGATARKVKKNLQADLSSRAGARVRLALDEALTSNAVIQAFAKPKVWTRLLVSRTDVGGGYGIHIDNAIMEYRGHDVRTDISFTLFLSEPDTYEGGELVIDDCGQAHSFKAAAGDLVIYPSSTLHQVMPVTKGSRIVCVGWIQSRFRNRDQREMVFDLENLRAELKKTHDANSLELLTLSKTIANLTRMWSD